MAESLFSDLPPTPPKVISFASPRGGMGTTLLAANLAITLAKKGRRVLLVDGALTEAGCHLALGMMRPEKHLGSVALKQVPDIQDAIVSTPANNLWLLAGSPDIAEVANLPYLVKQKILTGFEQTHFDYVLVDAGSGTGADTLDFLLSGSVMVLVCQGQTNALEPFYRFSRALLHRLLTTCLNRKRYSALEHQLHWSSPLLGLREVEAATHQDVDAVEAAIRARRFAFTLTGLQPEKEIRLGSQIEGLLRRYFVTPFKYIGGVEWDEQSHLAAQNLEVIAKAYPMCPFSMSVERMANLFLKAEVEPWPAEGVLPTQGDLSTQHAYALLDIPFNAGPKEIQTAYTKKLEPYLETSPLTVGLLSREEREAIRDAFEEGYKKLIHSGLRQRYDEELIARGLMAPSERVEEYREAAGEGGLPGLPAEPAQGSLVEDTVTRRERLLEAALQEVTIFDGAGIRKLREAQKISVEEIVSETNIRSWYIESIEEERFEALPALIYLKGFLKQIASYLHVDPALVLNDYLERYQQWHQQRPE